MRCWPDDTIDAVVFATPHTQHVEQVIRAATAGKHVFVRSRSACRFADGLRARAAAQAAGGVVLAVGFNRRFHPSMALLRHAVRSDGWGPWSRSARSRRRCTASRWRRMPGACGRREAPAGAMTAIGVHLVDGMIDLFGTNSLRLCPGGSARRPSGRRHHRCSWFASPTARQAHLLLHRCDTALPDGGLWGPRGLPRSSAIRWRRSGWYPAQGSGVPEVTETAGFNMLTAELEAFADCIVTGGAFPTPLDDIMHGVVVFEAVKASAEAGVPMTVA